VETDALVEAVAMRKNDDLIVHLVNHSGKESLGGGFYPVTEYMPEVRNVRVSLKLDRPGREIFSVPDGAALDFTEEAGRAELVVGALRFMESLSLPGYFG
jgi:hypothetical protein